MAGSERIYDKGENRRKHDGAVYLARTSDGGTCWHGFPVPADKIPLSIERQLKEQAASTGELQELKRWLSQTF